MKALKILGFVIAIAFGIFMVIFGEGDDSPGAQGLGVLFAIAGMWGMYRLLRKNKVS